MSKIKTLEQVINQFKEKNGDKYDYSLITNYTVGKDKCQIICPKHGIFETTFDNHIQGKGCKKCQYEKLHNDNAMSKEEFIKLGSRKPRSLQLRGGIEPLFLLLLNLT